jgi:hypothetical protein
VRLTVERTTSVRELIAAATTRLGLTEGLLSLTTLEGLALDLDATVGGADLFTQRPLLVVTAPPPPPTPVEPVAAPEAAVQETPALEAPAEAPAVAAAPAPAPVEAEPLPEEVAEAGEVAAPPLVPAPQLSAEDTEAVRRALYATIGAVLGALRSPDPATLVVASPAPPAPAGGLSPSPGTSPLRSLSVPPEKQASATQPSAEAEGGNEEGASGPLSPLDLSEAGVNAADAYEAAAATDAQGRPRKDSQFVSPMSAEPTAASGGEAGGEEAAKEAPPVAEPAQAAAVSLAPGQ